MPYRISVTPAAQRQLYRLPKPDQRRIREKIDGLKIDPHPPGVKKLRGSHDYFRVRCGNYRIVYLIDEGMLVVLIVSVGHRRETYRGM